MNKLIDWLISRKRVQARLKALGWMPPAPKAFLWPPGSGGPSAPPPPNDPPPSPTPPPNDQ